MHDVTMADVAERADVSKSTVSAVVNNKDIVKDSTRERVQEAIQELNYRPSRSAGRGIKAPDGKNIGFVIKEAGNPYYAEVLAGIREVASTKDYLTFVCSSEGHLDEEKHIVQQFSKMDLSGLIITPILNDDTDLSHIFGLQRSNIPFVLLEAVQGLQASLIDIDNAEASCEAVKHLIELGHERIVHFAGPMYSEHTSERIEGVRRAFSESRLIYDSDTTVLQAGDSFADGYERGLEHFGVEASDTFNERPTAVSCYNDLVALGLMRALRELHIDVPEKVSVVGFDDLALLDYFPFSLTTVHVPKREMGRKAAEILLRQIESSHSPSPNKLWLEARLEARSSTAPPPP